MMKFIVFNQHFRTHAGETDSEAEALALAEQLAADEPGRPFNVYSLIAQSLGESPVKVPVPVVTKDKVTLEAEGAAKLLEVTTKDAAKP